MGKNSWAIKKIHILKHHPYSDFFPDLMDSQRVPQSGNTPLGMMMSVGRYT